MVTKYIFKTFVREKLQFNNPGSNIIDKHRFRLVKILEFF